MLTFDREACFDLLHRWARWAERDWYPIPGSPSLGCYGTGYNSWGVQTNQKYVGAMALLATKAPDGRGVDRQWAMERALAALRFSLSSHRAGGGTCTDGSAWGNTWISTLGIERMMFGVDLLMPHLTDADRDGLRHLLADEADWLLLHHKKGAQTGIFADPWNHTGKNAPESNLWDGAFLWRTACMYPEHGHAADWQEQAHRFLINAVSVAADATEDRIVAGRRIRDRHVGANFFPHYALDHHGYFNVGYMVICHSNAAILHFDLKAAGRPRPETLDHHQADLWAVVRRMVFGDGRLARLGGDSRVRYAYCQDYLLPALLYAADRLGDEQAPVLVSGLLRTMAAEAETAGDGSFYGARLPEMREGSPYYYCRLESDRAVVLAFMLAHAERVKVPAPAESLERSLAGAWHDLDHGAVLHRSPKRLASFSWRAHGLTQGLCLPPGDGHLAEWRQNLAGRIRCEGDSGVIEGGQTRHRRLMDCVVLPFDGGFLTFGTVAEGVDLVIPEGWSGSPAMPHHLAFAALPDGHTVLGLQYCRNGEHRVFLNEVKGLLLNVPNDLFNGFRRTLVTAQGRTTLRAPSRSEEALDLASRWAVVDGRLGVMALSGATGLSVSRSMRRRGGKFHSLYVEELCVGCRTGAWAVAPGETVLDVGWAVVSGANAAKMRAFVDANADAVPAGLASGLRAVCVTALDGQRYALVLNIGDVPAMVPSAFGLSGGAHVLASRNAALPSGEVELAPGAAMLCGR